MGKLLILQLKEIDDETEEYVGVENEICVRDCLCSVQRAKQRFLYI